MSPNEPPLQHLFGDCDCYNNHRVLSCGVWVVLDMCFQYITEPSLVGWWVSIVGFSGVWRNLLNIEYVFKDLHFPLRYLEPLFTGKAFRQLINLFLSLLKNYYVWQTEFHCAEERSAIGSNIALLAISYLRKPTMIFFLSHSFQQQHK